jgi:esterase/lipase
MKRLQLIFLLLPCLYGGCQTINYTDNFKKIDWLIGTWKGEADGQPFYENWKRVSTTEFENINFSLCNGDTVIGGRSKIEIRNNKIAYTSGSLIWELKEINSNQVIFESTQHREKFTFSKTGKEEWKANLQYPNSSIEYVLARINSIDELIKNKPNIIEGNFEGFIEFNNKKRNTSIMLFSDSGIQKATTSTPDVLQLNQPFQSVCYNPPYLKLALQDGTQRIELNCKIENDTIKGQIAGEIPAKVFFIKSSQKITSSQNYKIQHTKLINEKITLAANLYLPITDKAVGAIIMICGTGQHTKEEYNGWADMLASKGIAVLTYDKRNVTNFPELDIRQRSSDIVLPGQLESDILTAVELLKSTKGINPSKIGLFGFSQGAVLAPIVASNNKDISFIVAVSGNTTTDKEFIINQSLNRLRQRNFSEAQQDGARQIMEQLFQYSKDKKNGKELQKQIDKAYESGYGQYSLPRQLPTDDEIKNLSTWNSFDHDPAKYLTNLQVPSYFVFGQNDILIPVDESIEILNKIYGSKQQFLTIKKYSNADHFIKTMPDRNNFDFPKYVNGYIDDLTKWIIERTN